MGNGPRVLTASNRGPFTLSGTRTHIVGRSRVAIVEPGPDEADHLDRIASAVEGADLVQIVLTHGHPDHAGGAGPLAARLGSAIAGPEGLGDRVLRDGDRVATDQGHLIAVHTPGHTPDHLCFHWPDGGVAEGGTVFVGDLLLGEGDTTWVGEYPGGVADYLESLERVRALSAGVLLPAHGPPLTRPDEALDRFGAHRRQRIAQVRAALDEAPAASLDDLLAAVYGSLPDSVRGAARRSLQVLVDHVRGAGG